MVHVPPHVRAEVVRAYADYLSRKYPGTTWSEVEAGDEADEVGAVTRRLISAEDRDALSHGFTPPPR